MHSEKEQLKLAKEFLLLGQIVFYIYNSMDVNGHFRFEMPFNVWCLGCNNHVGMGVRYNAEKKKIGMYYTTPLYEFRMKCHLCDNYFVIRTDPKVSFQLCMDGQQF